MDNLIKNASILLGLMTLVLSAVMVKVFPSNAELPDGFNTAVIAFEFAQSEVDVTYLIGDNDETEANRQAMRDGHKFDMVFPFAYAGFLALLLLPIILKSGEPDDSTEPLAIVGVLCALLTIPFDIHENFRLLAIIDAAETNRFTSGLFANLALATWLKWGAISITVFVISLYAFKQRRVILGLFGLGSLCKNRLEV